MLLEKKASIIGKTIEHSMGLAGDVGRGASSVKRRLVDVIRNMIEDQKHGIRLGVRKGKLRFQGRKLKAMQEV